ncbi:MAG: FAD-dependent oxidoreductase, partial [Promethearchaeia archaeon]
VGIDLELNRIDWDLISERMWSQINESKEMEEGLSNIPNLDLYRGRAEFTGEYEMRVKLNETGELTDPFRGERIILASGARSIIPPIEGLDEIDYITSETFFGEKFPEQPWESLIIIGGGIIAAEFAHIFSAFGTAVTVIEMLPRLVSNEEPEVSRFLETNFRKRMKVMLNSKAVRVYAESGRKTVVTENSNSGEQREVTAQEILVAAGVRSNADKLKVQSGGIEIDDQGWIKTDEFLETNKQNIWCIGDANGKYQFRHKANYEAEVCMNNIFGQEKQKVDYSAVPWAIYSWPQIGHVGMTEKEAIESGHQIYTSLKHYSSTAKGFAMGFEEGDTEDGFVKLVIDKSYKILGAHVVGPNAAVLVQPFVYLMNSGYTCISPGKREQEIIPKGERSCPEAGSFIPIYKSMIIHPSLNEVTGWAVGSLRPVNIEHEGHSHHH